MFSTLLKLDDRFGGVGVAIAESCLEWRLGFFGVGTGGSDFEGVGAVGAAGCTGCAASTLVSAGTLGGVSVAASAIGLGSSGSRSSFGDSFAISGFVSAGNGGTGGTSSTGSASDMFSLDCAEKLNRLLRERRLCGRCEL